MSKETAISDTDNLPPPPEQVSEQDTEAERQKAIAAYEADVDTMSFGKAIVERINKGLERREKASLVFNGVPYTTAYLYNQQKGINYAPPKNPKDDREVSFGLPHEKIVALCAVFLKYVFKRRFKCFDNKGRIVRGMGDIYDLMVEFSYKLEQFQKLLALIYWEVFTQGNAWVEDLWDVRTCYERDAYMKDPETGKETKLDPAKMDYSYEFLDGLTYKPGKEYQTRKAVSRLLDGRQVILDNPELTDKEEQPMITIEEEMSRADAKEIFGTLSRWAAVPETLAEINKVTGSDLQTLFDAKRLSDPKTRVLVHRVMKKEGNLYNVIVNGIVMLPKDTPFTLFYPRNFYPITNVAGERLTGSAYARSIPAKTKFNSDYIDWVLKIMALKFEQGANPPILAKGKYTLTRDMFRASQVTHGVSKSDYEFALPDTHAGLTTSDFSFAKFMKEIIEGQTLSSTTSGEVSEGATLGEIQQAQANQIQKLGFLMDGLILGFMDMALARAYTIESKYTMQTDETVVDGKTIPVYQNFTVSVDGIENEVSFDEAVGGEAYPVEETKDTLFEEAFQEKKKGYRVEKYMVNPKWIRERRAIIDVEIRPERVKDIQSELIMMFDEFGKLMGLFQGRISMEEMQKLYLELTGRPGSLFLSEEMAKLNMALQAQGEQAGTGEPKDQNNMGSFGRRTPQVNSATKKVVGAK